LGRRQQVWILVGLFVALFTGTVYLLPGMTTFLLWQVVVAGAFCAAISVVIFELWIRADLARRESSVQVLGRISTGDLSLSAGEIERSSTPRMAAALRALVANLERTIRRFNQLATDVARVTEQISGRSRTLARTADQQFQSTEATSASVTQIDQTINTVRRGIQDLSRNAEETSTSILEMSASIEEVSRIADTLSEFVEQTGTAFEEMSASINEIASNTEGFSSFATETASSIVEMNATTSEIGRSAKESAELARWVKDAAIDGRGAVEGTVDGMRKIQQAVEEAKGALSELADRSQEIGDIIRVIDEIAGQTNLLALNAAIIAAQAGESGKAFSVVAGQMKALSERVQAGTREIEDVVKTVQAESGHAVDSILRGSSRAREGAALIQQAEDALVEITRAARESGDRMGESASAAAEQMTAAASVSEQMEALREGVSRIRAATRQQAADNEVVQRRSDALREETQGVRDTVDVQTRGSARIGHSIEAVQRAVRGITQGLEQEGAASREVAEVVRRSRDFTRSHEESAAAMAEAACELERQAEALRAALRPFRT
jgi:methyl-accepting chemotaxis protein